MESPYSDYPTAAQTHGDNLGMPGPLFQRTAIKLAQRMSGADLYEFGPVRVIPTLRCPLMVIHGTEDLFVARKDMDAVEAATQSRPPEAGPTVYWRLPDTHHVLALRTDPAEFQRRVGSFLDDAMAFRRGQSVPLEAGT